MKEKKVEMLAMLLHEGGRKAVETGKVLVKPKDPGGRPFMEWFDLPEHAKEGRRIQARFLLDGRRRLAVQALFA